MYRQNLELANSNKTLSLLRTIDKLVLESSGGLTELCKQICREITENYNYPLAVIFSKDIHSQHLSLKGWGAGNRGAKLVKDKSLANAYLDINDNPWYTDPKAGSLHVLSDLSTQVLSESLHAANHKTIDSAVQQLGVKSICLIKLLAHRHLVGVMVMGFAERIEDLADDEKDFLERLGGAVGVALDNKQLFEENQHIVSQLKRSNDKLRQLDRTKDDFISMASHQLRTPLTSVKGYLSMTLEGDAGDISKKQRKLLSQAFISSQRMVYLIADMLNVSRLKTGKFVIEPEPTDLAEAVETEIEQLKGTAAARGLKLTYKKPQEFPTLMLDQTKIRQVIMNFADNAIYYTPSGGRIDVELKDTGKAIEFTVTDNGIGVPRREQRHLFSKFYRAANAKKVRPDGTGLGLYMAKKVIIGHGGSIIFKSQQGKGSTFGFQLFKPKLKSADHEMPPAKPPTDQLNQDPLLDTKP